MNEPRTKEEVLKVIQAYERNGLPVPQYLQDEFVAVDGDFFVYDDAGWRPSHVLNHQRTPGENTVRALALFANIGPDEIERQLLNIYRWQDIPTRRRTQAWRREQDHKQRYRWYFPDSVTTEWCETTQGWKWTPTMNIGTGTTVHLRKNELPANCLAKITGGYVAILDRKMHDVQDRSRGGQRAVYGYWMDKARKYNIIDDIKRMAEGS